MQEIEAKILEIDVVKTIEKLERLGAKKVFDGDFIQMKFDSDTHPVKDLLRLRYDGNKTELCHKRHLSRGEAKIVEETEVIVSDLEKTKKILEALGYRVVKKMDKHRMSYALGDSHIEIDTLPGIPVYLEVEAPSVDRLKEIVHLLGFTMDDAKPWTQADVERHYGK